MNVKFTARRFRAHPDIREHAIGTVRKLDRFYDGIVHADVILSYERATKSVKTAEINLYVHGTVLSARERSEDFIKSIDATGEKLAMQLAKYKTRLHAKDKGKVRAIKQKV
ncbi:MAG: ribosome-associated translation inhibitor RaiA [Bacteroidota bacterium]